MDWFKVSQIHRSLNRCVNFPCHLHPLRVLPHWQMGMVFVRLGMTVFNLMLDHNFPAPWMYCELPGAENGPYSSLYHHTYYYPCHRTSVQHCNECKDKRIGKTKQSMVFRVHQVSAEPHLPKHKKAGQQISFPNADFWSCTPFPQTPPVQYCWWWEDT